jgi:hypothetical protein
MPALQWRDVNAPQFGDSIAAYRMGADALSRGLATAKSGLQEWDENKRRETSNSLMADLMRFEGNPEALRRAQADGSLMARYDPRNLNAEAIAAIGARTQDLQNFQLGDSNIRFRNLQGDQLGQSNAQDARVNNAWQEDRTVFTEDRGRVRGARELYAQRAAIAAEKGPDAAQAFMRLPENQAVLNGLPQEVVDQYINGTLTVPRGEADLTGQINSNRLVYNQGTTEAERPALVREQTRGAKVDADTGAFQLRSSEDDRNDYTTSTNAINGLQPDATPTDVQNAYRTAVGGLPAGPNRGRQSQLIYEEMRRRFPDAFKSFNPDAPPAGDVAPVANPQPGLPVNPTAPRPAAFSMDGIPNIQPTLASGQPDWEAIGRRNQANEAEALLRPAAGSFGFGGEDPRAQLIRAAAPGMQGKGPHNILNYEARGKTGLTHVPPSVDTLGEASSFAKQLNKAGADSSAMGTYQIVGQTMRGYAPKVFGKNWQDVPFNQESQDRIGRAIFEDHRGSAAALRKQWVSLSLKEAEAVRRMPWEQARQYIAAGESGSGNVGPTPTAPVQLARRDTYFDDRSSSVPQQQLMRDAQPVDSTSPVNPLSGRLYGGSRSMEEAQVAPTRPAVAEQMLMEMMNRGPAPLRIAGNEGDARQTTNVAALLRNRAIAARARFG